MLSNRQAVATLQKEIAIISGKTAAELAIVDDTQATTVAIVDRLSATLGDQTKVYCTCSLPISRLLDR